MSLVPGTRFGAYEVEALIGVGGMGDVYRATDTNLKRKVALKVLAESFVGDANRLARLQREAELLAALNHTNVAHIYGLERSDVTTALVMELIEGETIAERLAQGRLPTKDALDLALQIAAGLEAAHERGIVHRDLKPANIKLKPDGTVKVLDFGIAKALDARAISGPQAAALTTPAMTEMGVVLGTAAYMAPEQARGKAVDRRADIWAFGCVLYEMLTGKAAFAADDVTATLARVLERDPDLRALPLGTAPAVRRTIELCLQKDVKKRLHDIGDVRLGLEGQLAASPEPTRGAGFVRLALPVTVALVIGLIAGAYSLNQGRATVGDAPNVTRFVITPPANALLASTSGLDVAVSPDGKRLAYLAQNPQTGVTALYVRELDDLEARLIPDAEFEPGTIDANPFFSPDGKWIAVGLGQKGFFRVSLEGASPLKMADDPQPFVGGAWLADDTILFSAAGRLHRVSAGGGSAPQLLSETPLILGHPSPLPGGRVVILTCIEGTTERRVCSLDLESGEPKPLIEDASRPTYVATGHIVFVRGTALMAVPFDAAKLSVTGEPVALLQGVRHPNTLSAPDYALSATGTLVYVPGGTGTTISREVVWVDRNGRVIGRAVDEIFENPRNPRLSPDNRRLVLTTGLSASEGSIWAYDLNGRPSLPLSVGGDNHSAVWSPDGAQVVFTKGRAGQNDYDLYTIPADGSELRPRALRAERTAGIAHAWLPTGDLLVTSLRATTGPDILAIRVSAAGEARDVVATEGVQGDPALSPNGRWLAYVSDRSGTPEIWVKRYPDGVPDRVSHNGGFEPLWSADGGELFYLQDGAMMAVAFETEGEFGEPVQLFGAVYANFPPPQVRSYDVAREGHFLMIRNATGSGDFVVVENWTEELKQHAPARR